MMNIYQTRFQSLIDEITHFKDHTINLATARAETIRAIAEKLLEFASQQFQFFQEGFFGIQFLEEKNEAESITKEFVFGDMMRQISADFTVLERAYFVRAHGSPAQKAALVVADYLAYKALDLAKNVKRDALGNVIEGEDGILIHDHTTALTYFQKTAFVRVIPYAPVAIVGIPVTTVNQEKNFRDFLAIPHEIGHYVYWHARTNTGEVVLGNDARLSREIYLRVNKLFEGSFKEDLANDFNLFEEIVSSNNEIFEECGIDLSKLQNFDLEVICKNILETFPKPTARWFLREILGLAEEETQCFQRLMNRPVGNIVGGPRPPRLSVIVRQLVENIKFNLARRKFFIDSQEEIFADVYGTLVAGPEIAIGFQELLFDNYFLFEDDTKHPIAVARPYIYNHTLELQKDNAGSQMFPKSPPNLLAEWRKRLGSRGVGEGSKLPESEFPTGSANFGKTVQDIRGDYRLLVAKLTDLLEANLTAKFPLKDNWTPDNPNPIVAEHVYGDFETFLAALPANLAVPEFDGMQQSSSFYFNFLHREIIENGTIPPNDCDALGQICYSDWEKLISESGWTIGGPEADGSSPP